MSDAPTYTITKVSDFLAVPEDRRGICLREFQVWLGMLAAIPAVFDGIKIKPPKSFIWIDDDLHTATIRFHTDSEDVAVIEGVMKGFS